LKIRYLTLAEVLAILQDQIRRYGGRYAVRDPALLSSALAMPAASYEGKLLHTDIYEQAAAYAYHICQNHAFVDGNKRTALAAALVFLELNGVEVVDPKEELFGLMMNVASGTKSKQDIAVQLSRLGKRKMVRKRKVEGK
jgi:death-on-curing protein